MDVTYQKLTTVGAVRSASNSGDLSSIYSGQSLTIPVRCYCGDPNVDPKYGLFSTYVVQADDQLTSLSTNFSVDADVISKFNSDTRNLSPDSIIFIPSKGRSAFYLDGCNVLPIPSVKYSIMSNLNHESVYYLYFWD